MQEVLHEDEARFGKVRTKKLMKMKSDLMWLQRKVGQRAGTRRELRRLLRGHRRTDLSGCCCLQVLLLKPVLKSLLRKVDGDLNLYFQDIDDHLERCSEVRSLPSRPNRPPLSVTAATKRRS